MVRLAATVALLQASYIMSLVALGALPSPTTLSGQPGTDVRNLLTIAGSISEAICIIGFAVALLKRHVWGAFALLTDSVISTLLKPLQFGASATLGSLVFVVIYGAGAWTLRHSEHKRPHFRELKWHEIVRYGLLLFAGLGGIGFIFGFIGLRNEMVFMPSFWALYLLWALLVLALAAKFDTRWPFETVLGVCLIASSFGLLVDVPIHVAYEGMSLGNAILSWLSGGILLIALGVVAWGVAAFLPLPIMQPGETAKAILGFGLIRQYDHAQVMRDTRRLLLIIGTINMGLAYYLFSGGALRELTREDWAGFATIGTVYMTAGAMKSFWFRFICVVFWTCDLFYSSILLPTEVRPSMFIPIGAYFTYQMWIHRNQALPTPTIPDTNTLEKAATSGIANRSISYGFGLANTPDPSSGSSDRTRPTDSKVL